MTLNYQALYEEEKHARQQAEALIEVASLLNAKMGLDESLSAICNTVAQMLDVPIVTISLYDETREELYLAYEIGLPAELRQNISSLPRHVYESYMEENGRLIIVPNVQSLENLPNLEIYQKLDVRTTVGMSMLLDEKQLIGRMNLGTIGLVREFSDWEIGLLRGLAEQAAVAIHRAILLKQTQEYADSLEMKVAERTEELEASNLEKAKALTVLRQYTSELQMRNEELDAFSYTVAHDLRNPLATLVGFAEMIFYHSELLDEEEHQEYLGKIVRQGKRMSNIINELLLLANIRKADIDTKPIHNMEKIIKNALERITQLSDEFEATSEFPKAWPVAVAYGPWLEEVWVNYLSNAIKYGGRPPHLTLKAIENGEYIRFGVQDNGQGLTEEEQSRLFTPFTRLQQVRTEGFGLGLSIVARIMEKLDGKVGVESVLGEGSFFYFELPRLS